MNDKLKLAALLLVSFVATGAVIYQLMNRRPVQTGVVLAPPGSVPAAGSRGQAPPSVPPQIPASPAAGVTAAAAPRASQAVTAPVLEAQYRLQIPETGWARNPFLTLGEIDRLNRPEEPVAEAPPPPKPAAEPPALPDHSVTGIISGGSQGNWAIIDSRTMRAGDRLGSETVAQVKDRSVILERDGHTRELPLKNLEDTAAAAPPKKEAKQ